MLTQSTCCCTLQKAQTADTGGGVAQDGLSSTLHAAARPVPDVATKLAAEAALLENAAYECARLDDGWHDVLECII